MTNLIDKYIGEGKGKDPLTKQIVKKFEKLFHSNYDSYVARTSRLLDKKMEYFDETDILNSISNSSKKELQNILKNI
jgi:hypothetical protein